jgi:hypothetical protein
MPPYRQIRRFPPLSHRHKFSFRPPRQIAFPPGWRRVGDTITLARNGLRILGCPAFTDNFCTTRLDLSCSKIGRDLDLVQDVQYLHQRAKLTIYCCNTSATHLVRSFPLHISEPRLSSQESLESAFDSFMAHILGFELDYDSGPRCTDYQTALAQLCLGIKQGGF